MSEKLINKLRNLLDENLFEEVIDYCNQALIDTKQFDAHTLAQIYCAKGLAKDELEDRSEAIKNFNLAIKIDSEYSIAYGYRGYSYYFLKDYESAITNTF